MMKLIAPICLLAFVVSPSSDRIRKYQAVEAYEIRPGIIVTPVYTASHDLCEISIEKRHYSNNIVDMDATMSKEQVLSMFDELVPKGERGGPGWGLPPDTEYTECDGGMCATRIRYENVSLMMHRLYKSNEYVSAIIYWNKPECNAN